MKTRKLILWSPKPFTQKPRSGKAFKFPPLGLGTIAALTPEHWDVVIRDANYDTVQFEECDMVGISAMTCQALTAYEISKIFREKKVPVVLGGIHGTMCTDEALEFVDVVVKGEAENIWKNVIYDFENNQLKKVYENLEFSPLENMPAARFDLFNPGYKWGLMYTSRGCPYNCEFCSVVAFNGGHYRRRPIPEILDEIGKIPQKNFLFADSNILGHTKKSRQEFKEICEGMIKRKIKKRWFAQTSIQFSVDEEIMKLAKDAGCIGVLIGIESVQPEVLAGNMNKKMNIKFIEESNFIKKIQKNKISVMSFFLFGNDEDTKDSFKISYDKIKKINIDITSGQPLVPHPGTPLFRRLLAENRLLYTNFPEDWAHYYDGKKIPLYKLKSMSNEDFIRGINWINDKLLSIHAIIKRLIHSLTTHRRLFNFFHILTVNISTRKDIKRLYRR